MPKLAANLSMLFTELDFLARFQAAAKAGFKGVEYLFPYAYDKHQLAQRLKDNGLVQVLHNLPAGNWDAGERGIACHPDRVAEFRQSVATAAEYARALGCPRVNCLAGITPPGADPKAVHDTFVANLSYAAGELKKAGVLLVMEPINTFDMPGFYLSHTQQAVDLIAEVGSDNLKVQYDIYHMQRMEGELANTMSRHLGSIGHMQLADNPGRHEPGTGEINFAWLLHHIDTIGYDGWIGCEYKPATRTEDGLRWIKAMA
ncbi:MAG: hydroxypyruvate isomerase [Castellaniella sp.]|uniref:hydroxypyruvate isomerase n=1 Tax=Castellaniella sp. TaxID=1955812 RepID=UPI001212B00C|nr:hydroxypyruvate isomerase [Castellaniella sp.]TAN27080.1 MAG: hydroxypyruvate isomerase [Castellaniella sp.]